MSTETRNYKKEAIIKSSKSEILKKGYRNTSVENITSSTNIAKGSFYTYFKTKEALLSEIIQEILDIVIEADKVFFEKKDLELENIILKGIEKRFYLEEERIINSLFLVNLTSNLEVLGDEIREKLIQVKKNNVLFWRRIFLDASETLNLSESETLNYAVLIDDIVYSAIRKVIFYSHDIGIYVTDIEIAKERIRSQEVKDEIKFIHKVIMNILRGER